MTEISSPPHYDELTIPAKIENIDTVQQFVSVHLSNCPQKTQTHIKIAIDEIFSNIVKYAVGNGFIRSEIKITIRLSLDDNITLIFEDNGTPFDPLSVAPPDTSLPEDERTPGGLGLFIVQNIMDSVEYRYEDNKNILTIKKNIRV
jgi:anti-sigma regulatory factor (Ser/Thr protein kinase)